MDLSSEQWSPLRRRREAQQRRASADGFGGRGGRVEGRITSSIRSCRTWLLPLPPLDFSGRVTTRSFFGTSEAAVLHTVFAACLMGRSSAGERCELLQVTVALRIAAEGGFLPDNSLTAGETDVLLLLTAR